MAILPQLLEPLSIVIAKTFVIADLEGIMLKTTGEGLYEVWVGRNLPDRDTALELLKKVSQRDIERIIFVEMRARRPNDTQLIGLIGQACPEALKELPTTDEHVDKLVSGLAAIKAKLSDQGVKDAVNGSRAQLQSIVLTIDTLGVYKSLHESLHQLQAKQFHSLRSAAKKISVNPEQADELRAFRQQLRSACLFARGAIKRLSGQPVVRDVEARWIDKLEQAGDKFHDAIDQKNPQAARLALKDIRAVMRNTPPRLNTLIFMHAKLLPLDELAKALGKVIEAGGGEVIKAGRQSLLLIMPTLRARVVEHENWQAADDRISALDDLIDGQPSDLIEEFVADWLPLQGQVRALTAQDPEAPWARKIDVYSGRVTDYLAKEIADAGLTDAFADFRSDAQYHFLLVDSNLKSDCDALLKISEPLHNILTEIGQ